MDDKKKKINPKYLICMVLLGIIIIIMLAQLPKHAYKYEALDWVIILGVIAVPCIAEGVIYKKYLFSEKVKVPKTKINRDAIKYINPYVDVSAYDTGDNFPPVNYNNVFLQPDEWIIYAVPANTFTEKEQVVGYSGGNAGVSIRVAKGVSVRTGSSKGRAVRQNVTKFYSGDYVVTNKRIIFVSKDDGFEFSVKKISAIKVIAKDAFFIAQGNKQKNICVDESQIKYVSGLTSFAVKAECK